MNQRQFRKLAKRLLQQPTAPYHEHGVRSEIERICREHELKHHRDEFGNLLVEYAKGPKQPPVVLAAHMDHPGFEIVESISERSWRARFCGSVGESYFRPGVKVRLHPGNGLARLAGAEPGEKMFRLESGSETQCPPQFAVWDLEDFAERDGLICARACDDLIGVAAALATLMELKRTAASAHAVAALSRAEEVGFQGALALAAGRVLPADALVISLETSRELPGVKMGHGVILRVGDRASIFNSQASRYLAEIAAETKRPGFRFQRALMGGGTCEATAYQECGYTCAAVCVALGNYHNCGLKDRVKAEYVSMEDCLSMVTLLVQTTTQVRRYGELVDRLPARLRQLTSEARARLPQSAL